ncbi:MAG: hydroxyacid dehydrogenase [Alphaproteobacteria bacterium RIFCSPHIGHO2_12_FULL_63_12]|nr:MAG: hydroxyacid dehydrogenase [Alphaproteobacteria bacterium RIFCSPHIGHO2_12_FULL_63_12]
MTAPETVISDIRAIVGPKGVIDGADAEPLVHELRGWWPGKASLVVAPASAEEVSRIVRTCARAKVAITPQGGNTGLVGGQMPQNGEILISLRRMRKIRAASAEGMTLTVDAGVTLAEAQQAAAAIDRLFPLSIGSEGTCQIGGVISTNAGGVNVLRYGNMRDLVLGLEVVLPDGEIWNGLKSLRKDNTGYDLKQLFVGGEGTLGVVTGAALKLFPRPRERVTAFVALASPDDALSMLTRAQIASGGNVTSFELMSRFSIGLVYKHIPGARDPLDKPFPWYVLAEFSSGREGALRADVEAILADAFEAGLILDATIAENEAQAAAFWHLRHVISVAMRPEGAQAKFDVSVPVASVPAFLKDAGEAVEKIHPGARVIAFGHLGDGNIHYDLLQPEGGDRAAFEQAEDRIEQAVYDAIDRHRGSISAEHGVGLARRDDIARRKQPAEIAMMRAIKRALDPQGIMNPGKMI